MSLYMNSIWKATCCTDPGICQLSVEASEIWHYFDHFNVSQWRSYVQPYLYFFPTALACAVMQLSRLSVHSSLCFHSIFRTDWYRVTVDLQQWQSIVDDSGILRLRNRQRYMTTLNAWCTVRPPLSFLSWCSCRPGLDRGTPPPSWAPTPAGTATAGVAAVTGSPLRVATIPTVTGSRRQLRGSRSYAGTCTGIAPADTAIEGLISSS